MMVRIIRSTAAAPNTLLKEMTAEKGEGNLAWLHRQGDPDGIILIGGSSVADFRIRVAQSTVRGDMLPSLWSLCGILVGGGMFASVPLDLRQGAGRATADDVSAIPQTNGVRMCALADFDDPVRYPNLAYVRFAQAHVEAHNDITRVQSDRTSIDVPALMVPWLAYIWGVTGASNPLSQGLGLPSAAFVETVFAMAGFELTPGLSSTSSCPEAIWQSAKWWTAFYEGTTSDSRSPKTGGKEEEGKAVGMVPRGACVVRQPAAAAIS
jgi:hypothetical protein